MTRLFIAAMAVCIVALSATAAMAQPAAGPKVAVHIIPHPTGKAINFCDGASESTMTACSNFVTQGDLLTGYDLFIVAAQADSFGISGMSFGIQYNGATGAGVDFVGGFLLCASGLQFPSTNWPASGEGNVITWNRETRCGLTRVPPDGIQATAGGFYVYAYSDDIFKITNHNKLTTPSLKVSNCPNIEQSLDASKVAGWVGFGGSNSCNPCLVDCSVPAEKTTWGRIKAKYPKQDLHE
jgi:hypothetical protein